MNYLAHAFLSFGDRDILGGNMISDFVKGKTQYDYPLPIQKGIRVHRMIDAFTDAHKATARAKDFFRPQYRLYSGAFVDVVFDHFLSIDKNYFYNDEGLMQFSQQAYFLLEGNLYLFPTRFQKMFPFMKEQNWLYNYQFMSGIKNSFKGIVHRASYLSESDSAFEIFNKNYSDLKNCYESFFKELYNFSSESINLLQTF